MDCEGRIGDVVTYCEGDVERLRAVHRRIRGLGTFDPTRGLMTRKEVIADFGIDPDLMAAADAVADAARQAEIDEMPDFPAATNLTTRAASMRTAAATTPPTTSDVDGP